MKHSIIIGGPAGTGINKAAEILSKIFINKGYFVFNYRDYQSLVKGGHNFNLVTFSDKKIGSNEGIYDLVLALDKFTKEEYSKKLKDLGKIFSFEEFNDEKRDSNIYLIIKAANYFGIEKELLKKVLDNELNKDFGELINEVYSNENVVKKLEQLNNNLEIMTGSKGVAIGAINSGIQIYNAYPMTPATGLMNELNKLKDKNDFITIQSENELAVVNFALGSSFAGAKSMIGSSGGGVDLMSEGLSFQGISEIPLVVYLASRASAGTGIPTYSGQGDINLALNAGHGEFPRVVISPGDSKECIEKTNESFYLSEKFKVLSIILSDKNLAESEFSFIKGNFKPIEVNVERNLPGGNKIVKASSYESDERGNTIEDEETTIKNIEERIKKKELIKEEISKFETYKIHGKEDSKNLIISTGSTKGVILDAIDNLNCKFLQIIYLEPFVDEIKEILNSAEKLIIIEENATGQLRDLIRKNTGIKIKNQILNYGGRPLSIEDMKSKIQEFLNE
jgi:2-oxoglutarate/2-oxoacid ferredoxin oxidoreductase subunit alpha